MKYALHHDHWFLLNEEDKKEKAALISKYGRRGRSYREECRERNRREKANREEARNKMEIKVQHLEKKHGMKVIERNRKRMKNFIPKNLKEYTTIDAFREDEKDLDVEETEKEKKANIPAVGSIQLEDS